MQQSTITFIVAGIGVGGALLTFVLTKSTQEARANREERRQEYRELVTILTKCYMRIVSPYDPPIPVIDPELQRQITDAKLEAFQVLQDRIVIADELENAGILDTWTEAVVSLERNADSVGFAKKFRPLREQITRMANRPPPKEHGLRLLYTRLRYFREIRRFKETNRL